MAFEIGSTVAVLQFDQGTALEGAKVRVSLDMSVRDFLALQRTIAGISADSASMSGEALEQWEAAYRMFAGSSLRSWDLSRDDKAIPATVDGFMSLPFSVANSIFVAWAQALGGPPPNLRAASESGDTSAAG